MRSLIQLFAAALLCSTSFAALSGEAISQGRIEFNGVFRFGDSVRVSLHDKKDGTCAWLRVGQSFGELELLEVSQDNSTVRLDHPDRVIVLELKQVRVKPLSFGASSMRRDSDADIAFDADMILMFERGQEISKRRSRTR